MIGRDHFASLELENAARSALNIDGRRGLNGIIDADFIDIIGNAYIVLAVSLAPYYKIGNAEQRSQINGFLDSYYHLSDIDLEKTKYYSGVRDSAEALKELIKQLG